MERKLCVDVCSFFLHQPVYRVMNVPHSHVTQTLRSTDSCRTCADLVLEVTGICFYMLSFPLKETFMCGFSSQSVRAESGSADGPSLTGSRSVRATAFLTRKGVVYCFQGHKVSYLPLGGKRIYSYLFYILNTL